MHSINSHYYILPDGSTVPNMKEGKLRLGKGSDAFRSLVRKGIIRKVKHTHKLLSDDNTPLTQ